MKADTVNQVEEERSTSLVYPIILWFVFNLFFSFQFILRMSVGILKEDIIDKFNVDIIQFGSLAGYYYLGYAIMQIPIGFALDKFNYRYVTFGCILLTVFGTLTFVLSDNWNVVLMGRFFIGVGSAVGILSVSKIISAYFPAKYRATLLGFTFTLGLMGAVFGGKPMKLIFEYFGYYNTFIFLAGVSLILGVLGLFISKNAPENSAIDENVALKDVIYLLSNRWIFLIGIFGGLMVGYLEGLADVWLMSFFKDVYGFSTHNSIFANSFIFIGMCFGGPFIGALTRYVKSRELLIFIFGIIAFCALGSFFYFKHMSLNWAIAICFIIGITCCYQMLVFDLVSEITDVKMNSLAISIVNCLNMSFGLAFHKMMVIVIDYNWAGALSESGKAVYGYDSYFYSFAIIPVLSFIGQIGFLYIGSKHSKIRIGHKYTPHK